MLPKHLIEDRNNRVIDDTSVYGQTVSAGTKIFIVSKQGEYKRSRMRVPPPEFEGLLIFSAIGTAAKAEVMKKMVCVTRSQFDGMKEVEMSEENQSNFFESCQNAMASIASSVSSLESWANKSIALLGYKNGKPIELILERPGKSDRTLAPDKVASDLGIPIRPKLLQLIPQVFSIKPLKEKSKLRDKLGEIIEDRNIVMHMQNRFKTGSEESERVSFAVKLFKEDSFRYPAVAVKYMSLVYEKSEIQEPEWLQHARKELKNLREKIK